MNIPLILVIIVSLLMGCANSTTVSAKPSAPVAISSTQPNTISAGDEFSATLTFTAQSDIKQLDIKLSPYQGIEVVSTNTETSFYDLKRSETRTLEVTLRLLQLGGYLSVFATTTSNDDSKKTKAATITFGNIKNIKRSASPTHTIINGEKLILMPAKTAQ